MANNISIDIWNVELQVVEYGQQKDAETVYFEMDTLVMLTRAVSINDIESISLEANIAASKQKENKGVFTLSCLWPISLSNVFVSKLQEVETHTDMMQQNRLREELIQ